MALSTYLSDCVYDIIVKLAKNNSNHKDIGIATQLLFDWQFIHKCMGDITDDFDILDQTQDWYKAKAQFVWDVFHSAESAVEKASSCGRHALYQLCQWMCCQHDVAEYISWTESDPDTGNLQAVLHLTAAFERALGNLYLMKNHPVPFLLRDLLKSPEITNMFGKVPVCSIHATDTGLPKGLQPPECCVAWLSFPGRTVILHSSRSGCPLRFPRTTSTNRTELTDVFCDISSEDEEVLALIKTSPYISDNTKQYWRRAYQLLQTNRYGECLVLLLPQLEHCLRTIYCLTNGCPARLLTAESTTLYTTLDDVLAQHQPGQLVGPGLLMALLDLLASLSGPRLRDRLSHGEVDLRAVPQWLANHTFCIGLSASHHMDCGCAVPLCHTLQTTCSSYQSRFHVLASLYKQLIILLEQWPNMDLCSPPPDLSVISVTCPHVSRLDSKLFPRAQSLTEKLDAVRACLVERPSTLYRPRSELEQAAGLLSVTQGVRTTCVKITAANHTRRQQWDERTLRSRARLTCQRMWSAQPALASALLCVVKVTALCGRALPTLALPTQLHNSLRLIKSMTKAVENAAVMCDLEKNRWNEALTLFSQLAAELCDNSTLSSLLIENR